ncbi:DUF2334 domain-containing protein [Piscinibacter koreensis]|uniref:DUF2334 domain-containing protein n=1 Tax=Piscinibacter koreensis TaxID=2742824 RepID=A0A7Y6NLS7_9BURK|nr:polysaccharide deacetylase family protein [Schlegelella koreensis]NUZ05563.1 DUF2334 domain-containing protein [Schlegelella koreensis]
MNAPDPSADATGAARRHRDRPAARPAAVLCVVLHDVATSTRAACERVMRAVTEVAPVPLTLLAVPRYHHETPSAAFEQWLGERSRAGDELSLHGLTHLDDTRDASGFVDRIRRRSYTRGEGEFSALDAAEATRRLQLGIDWFAANGWPLHGFVAPAWLLGPGAWQALGAFDFRYTSTLRHIHLLRERRRLTSQSVVYSTSAAWRRASSVVWAAVVERAERANPLLRIELHPRDADHAAVRRSWQRILERHLATRQALTVVDALARVAPAATAG